MTEMTLFRADLSSVGIWDGRGVWRVLMRYISPFRKQVDPHGVGIAHLETMPASILNPHTVTVNGGPIFLNPRWVITVAEGFIPGPGAFLLLTIT